MTKINEDQQGVALAVPAGNALHGNQFSQEQIQAFVPQNREQLEMLMELNALEKTVESIGEKTTKPSDLVESGVVFDILDAWFGEIQDGDELKPIVFFQLEEVKSGIQHVMMQGRGSVRDTFANFFAAHKAVGIPKRLANYRMVHTDKTYKAGNPACVFERVNPTAKAIKA